MVFGGRMGELKLRCIMLVYCRVWLSRWICASFARVMLVLVWMNDSAFLYPNGEGEIVMYWLLRLSERSVVVSVDG